MHKELLYKDNNVSEHVQNNMKYDKHLKNMKGIYGSNAYVRNKFSQKNNSAQILKVQKDHHKTAYDYNRWETEKFANKENTRLLSKMEHIKKRPSTNMYANRNQQDGYKNLKLHNMIQKKRMDYDHQDEENKRMSERISNQKPEIKVRNFEKDYQTSMQYQKQIRKQKPLNLPKKHSQTVLQNCLVYNEGRYRLPGSDFMSHRHFKHNSLIKGRRLSLEFQSIPEEKQKKIKKEEVTQSNSVSTKPKKFKNIKSSRKLKAVRPLTLCSFFREKQLKPFDPKFLGLTPVGAYDVDIRKSKDNQIKTKRSAQFSKINPIIDKNQVSQTEEEFMSKKSAPNQ